MNLFSKILMCLNGGMIFSVLAAPMTAPTAPFLNTELKKEVSGIPKVRPDGFYNGDKSFRPDRDGVFNLFFSGRNYGYLIPSFRTDGAVNCNMRNMKDAKSVFDASTSSFVHTGKIPLDHGTDGKNINYAAFTHRVTLLPDGRIKLSASYECAPEVRHKLKGSGSLTWWAPVPVYAGQAYRLNGVSAVFPGSVAKETRLNYGKFTKFELNPGRAESEFTLELPESQENLYLGMYPNQLEFRIPFSKDGKAELVLDLRKNVAGSGIVSADTHMGIDFWKSGRLHVPDFSASRNLLPNPSFEGGLRYYFYNGWGNAWTPPEPLYSISEKESKIGNRSLRLIAGKGITHPGLIQTSAIPVVPNKKYTLSFYAKADQPDCDVSFVCVSAQWPKFPPMPAQKITTEWKRYSVPFTTINRGISIAFQGAYRGKTADIAKIYLDGFQLEEGEKATEFVDKPVIGELVTVAGPGNFLKETAPVNAVLNITSRPGTSGTVQLTMEDFFGKKTALGKFQFKTDAKGRAAVRPALKRMPGKGLFVVEAKYELADGTKSADYYRISVMTPMKGVHKHKNTFGTIMSTGGVNSDDVLKRYRDVGFGSTCYGPAGKDIFELYKKYGFQQMDHSIFTIMMREKNPLVKILQTTESVTPEIERAMEEASYDIARRYPWVTNWYGTAESDIYFKVGKMGKLGDIAKLQRAALRGIKRFDKNKLVYIEGGPCNMMPQNGTRVYEEYMKDHQGKARFDAAAIHPYCGIPESPDLDEAAQVFFATLAKYGYDKVPVYWKEGIYYAPYEVPEWDLTLLRGYDHYRLYSLSYHLGWNERMAAALAARNFLVALKYADRVQNFNAWLSWTMLDCNFTPMAVQKSINTLARLLGDADFRKDIRFAPDSRSYIFEDAQKRPVAAVWSYIPSVDNGSKEAPFAAFQFKSPVEVFDLMETAHESKPDANGRINLPISSFPIFIRGKAGTLDSFVASIASAKMLGAGNLPVKVSATLSDGESVELHFRNHLSRPLSAEIDVCGKKSVLKFKGGELKTEKLRLPEKVSSERISKVKLPVKVTVDGVSADCSVELPAFLASKRTRKITVDGDLSDWKGVPAISISNHIVHPPKIGRPQEKSGYPGDISAQYRVLWDEKALYLAVEVQDDKFHHTVGDNGGRWANDSLQLFVDTMNDARTRTTGGFDINDYNYDFYPNPDGSVTVYCRYVPDQQLAGGLNAPKKASVAKDIQARFMRMSTGYRYEIAIPYYMLLPMKLQKNYTAGFALTVNDHDGGDAVKGALNSTEKTEAHMNPDKYPVMVLGE